jgi:hypothetical protein
MVQSRSNRTTLSSSVRINPLNRLHLRYVTWGALPYLAITTSLGLLGIAFAYRASYDGATWAGLGRWLGLACMFLPVAARLLMRGPSRAERVGLLGLLSIGFYLVKILYSPFDFKFVDELQHWRTAADLLTTGQLFTYNYSLPLSPFYPGLEIITTALVNVTGLHVVTAGLMVVGASKVLFILALYLFYEHVSRSAYVASLGALVAMTNPHFLIFSSSFAYQSLALPLAVLALLLLAKLTRLEGRAFDLTLAASVFVIFAVITTHHVTAFMLLAFLGLWAVVAMFVRRSDSAPERTKERLVAGSSLVIGVTLLSLWITFVAVSTSAYLSQPLLDAFKDVLEFMWRDADAPLLRTPNPLHELIISAVTVVLFSCALLYGLWVAFRRYRHNALALALGLGSLSYFVSVALRFSGQGAELSGRLWSFVFVALAFTVALGFAWLRRTAPNLAYPLQLLTLTVFFLGSVTAGYPAAFSRLPGSYLPSAFERSVEAQGVSVALWSRQLGEGQRIATDFTNQALLNTYGDQNAVRTLTDAMSAPTLTPEVWEDLKTEAVDYVLTDFRLTEALPKTGYYFDPSDVSTFVYEDPLPRGSFEKFMTPGSDLLLDAGDLKLFDIRSLYELQE